MLWKYYHTKPQHMVVFLTLEIVSLPQGVKNPRFPNRGFTLLCVVLVCLHELRMAGYVQPKKCLSAAKTGFGRNSRQTKSSPKRGGFGASWGLLLAFDSHIGTQKCSNFVVRGSKTAVYCGFMGRFEANSGSAMADEQYLDQKNTPQFIPIIARIFMDCNLQKRTVGGHSRIAPTIRR